MQLHGPRRTPVRSICAVSATRTLNPRVLAVRCPIERKEFLIEAAPDIYFDDDHYRGYPAVLVRLEAIGETELAALLADACAMQAAKPKRRKR